MSQSALPPIGIDLGTTFSCVATVDASGRPLTLQNAEGDLITPSVVFFDRKGVLVGKEAVQAGEFEPERLAQFAKRDMGEQAYSKPIQGVTLPPEVLQALVLRKLKADAELKIGPFQKAVITVPAYFNEPCRKATQDAGRLAGLEVLDIINEPTAAAITFGVQRGFLNAAGEADEPELIMVYDLGGGTFDVTVMEVRGRDFRAVATAGDVYLGGIDWDRRIADEVAERFEAEYGVDPRDDPAALQQLLQTAAEVKHALTAREEMNVFFKFEDQKLRTVITRQQFEDLTGDLLDRTILTTRDVLRDGRIGWEDITRLLLVGGSTRMPMVTRALERESGKELDRSLAPDEAVAHGAALYAGMLLQSGSQKLTGISVTNVNSHDLGVLAVETSTGRPRRQVMIPRNTRLPATIKRLFKTARAGQPNVKVEIVEGGDDAGMGATQVGKCVVRDLPRDLPAETPVEVTFQYEANGRLIVRAQLPTIKKDAALQLDRASGLPEEGFQTWLERIDRGLSDTLLAELRALAPVAEPQVAVAAPEPPLAAESPASSVSPAPRELFPGLPSEDEGAPLPKIVERPPGAPPVGAPPVGAPPIGAPPPLRPVAAAPSTDAASPVIKRLAPAHQSPSGRGEIKKLGAAQQVVNVKKLVPPAPPKKLVTTPAVPDVAQPAEDPAASPPGTSESGGEAGGWKSRRKKILPGDS